MKTFEGDAVLAQSPGALALRGGEGGIWTTLRGAPGWLGSAEADPTQGPAGRIYLVLDGVRGDWDAMELMVSIRWSGLRDSDDVGYIAGSVSLYGLSGASRGQGLRFLFDVTPLLAGATASGEEAVVEIQPDHPLPPDETITIARVLLVRSTFT